MVLALLGGGDAVNAGVVVVVVSCLKTSRMQHAHGWYVFCDS